MTDKQRYERAAGNAPTNCAEHIKVTDEMKRVYNRTSGTPYMDTRKESDNTNPITLSAVILYVAIMFIVGLALVVGFSVMFPVGG